jgi:hypothetical protein
MSSTPPYGWTYHELIIFFVLGSVLKAVITVELALEVVLPTAYIEAFVPAADPTEAAIYKSARIGRDATDALKETANSTGTGDFPTGLMSHKV